MTQERATFDAAAFFAALDAARLARSSNWKQVAQGADISPSTLTRMAQGKRPDVDTLAALCAWAGLDAGDYVRRPATAGVVSPEPLAQISTYLRADPNLSDEAATAIDELVKATYSRLRTRGG